MELAIDLIMLGVFLAGDWRIIKKTGRNPLSLLIPVYNILIHLDIAGLRRRWLVYAGAATLVFAVLFGAMFGPNWYEGLGLTGDGAISWCITLLLIPLCIKIAKKFGRSSKFGIAMALLPPVFVFILGFGGSVYLGEKPSESEIGKTPFVTKKRFAIALSSLLLLFGIGVGGIYYTTETYEECVARVKYEQNIYRTSAKGAGAAGVAGAAASTAGLTGSAMGVGSAGIAGGAFAIGLGWALWALPVVALFAGLSDKAEIEKQCGDKR